MNLKWDDKFCALTFILVRIACLVFAMFVYVGIGKQSK